MIPAKKGGRREGASKPPMTVGPAGGVQVYTFLNTNLQVPFSKSISEMRTLVSRASSIR